MSREKLSAKYVPEINTLYEVLNLHALISSRSVLMRLATTRRILSLLSVLLIIGTVFVLAGTFYTADHLAVRSVTTQRFVTPQGYVVQATLAIFNAGLFQVVVNFTGRILSGPNEVVRNSTPWTIDASSGGNYTFTLQIDNAAYLKYFTPLSPQPIFDFNVLGTTAYGLVGITLTGQRNINITGA